VIKNEQGIVLMGFKSNSNVPLFPNEQGLFPTFSAKEVFDRTTVDESDYFYKRKYTTNINTKNFLTGSSVEQSNYFGEVNDKILFPETHCTSLISCVLLERGKVNGPDFKRNPMMGTPINKVTSGKEQDSVLFKHYCIGLNQDKSVLFQGKIELAPLSYILHK
jgi:hypothetical protein